MVEPPASPQGKTPTDLALRLRTLLRFILPFDASVAVASEGEPELLAPDGRHFEHFPQTPGGIYSGPYPDSDVDLVAQIDALRQKGIQFLIFPATTAWWLDHYDALRHHLTRRYRLVHREPQTAIIYALQGLADTPLRRFGAPDKLPMPTPEMMALTTALYDPQRFLESGKQGMGGYNRHVPQKRT